MNYNELKLLKEMQVGRSSQQRQERYQRYQLELDSGLQSLNTFIASEFKDKDQAKVSVKHFFKAAKLKSQAVAPYLYLAYVMLLYKEKEKALDFIQQALRREPDNVDAQYLLKATLQTQNQNSSEVQRSLMQHIFNIRMLDYDSTELLLEKQISNIFMANSEACQVSSEPKAVLKLRAHLNQLYTIYHQINNQLAQLNDEDILPLKKKIQPLEQLLKQFENKYHISLQMQDLDLSIVKKIEYVTNMAQSIADSEYVIRNLDNSIETLMDQCDAIADQLDEWQAKYETVLLEDHYNLLISKVEEVQDALDTCSIDS